MAQGEAEDRSPMPVNTEDPSSGDEGPSGNAHEAGLSKKGTPWSEDEHRAFLLGLECLGKGNWRGISKLYVPSRTPTQVASHAQKHFLRLQGVTKRKSRFAAIEDEVLTKHKHQKTGQQHPAESSAAPGVPASAPYMGMPYMFPPMMFGFPGPGGSFMPPFFYPPPAMAAALAAMMSKPGAMMPGYPGFPMPIPTGAIAAGEVTSDTSPAGSAGSVENCSLQAGKSGSQPAPSHSISNHANAAEDSAASHSTASQGADSKGTITSSKRTSTSNGNVCRPEALHAANGGAEATNDILSRLPASTEKASISLQPSSHSAFKPPQTVSIKV